MRKRIRIIHLAASLVVAALAAATLPDGTGGYREANAQSMRSQGSRRVSARRGPATRPPTSANSSANASRRSSRSSRGESSTATPSDSSPPEWQNTAPRAEQGTQAAARAAAPPLQQPLMPGDLRLSRHLTKEPPNRNAGEVRPDTVPLTAEQRIMSYVPPARRDPRGEGMSRNVIAGSLSPAQVARRNEILARQAAISAKNNAAKAARQGSRRSSTTVSTADGASPPDWQNTAPRAAPGVQAAAQTAAPTAPLPLMPGDLRLSRHLTKEPPNRNAGTVRPDTVPLTPEQRTMSYIPTTGRSGGGWHKISQSLSPAQVARRNEILARQAAISARNNAAKAAREGSGRRASNSSDTGTQPVGWKPSSAQRIANQSKGPVATRTTLPPPPQMPNLRLSRHLTRESTVPGAGRVVPNPAVQRSAQDVSDSAPR